MKVLLIQSPLGPRQDYLVYPLGLAYLGTALESAGHDIHLVDLNLCRNPHEELQLNMHEFSPEVVGVSLRNLDNQARIDYVYYYRFFQEMLRTIRTVDAHVPLIAGGAGFSMFAELIMRRNPEIDLGVFLEAEESLPALLEALSTPQNVKGVYYRQNGDVIFSGPAPMPDFASLPFPKRTFSNITPYLQHPLSIGVQTKRGCPLHCAYCNYPFLSGKLWRMRTPKHICDELEYLNTLGVRSFVFADSIVNVPRSFSEEILHEMIDRKLCMEWVGYIHLQGLNKQYMLLAQDAGCKVMVFSPDAVSIGALEALKKGSTPQDLRNSLTLAKDVQSFPHLHFFYSFFLNPPGETLLGLLKTIWVYSVYKIRNLTSKRITVGVNWIRVEPYSEIYSRAIQEGVFQENTDLLPDDVKAARKTFYSCPYLRFLDPVLMTLLGVPHRAKRLLRICIDKIKSNRPVQ